MRIIKWEDGYPMEESLEELKKVLNGDRITKAIDAFYEALKENYYRYDNCFGIAEVEIRGEKMRVWQYHTMGWSGNEDIINTLKQSWLWDILLERYDRGGHYYFTLQKS